MIKHNVNSRKKHVIFILLFCSLSCTAVFSAPAGHINVLEFGAVGDGKTLDTEALQKAIDTCSDNGGGTVYVPPGTYLSGTLFLKSGVALYLDHGATLLGSTNQDDYPVTVPEYRSYTDNYVVRSLIYAEKAEHISIFGRGIIDGQGEVFKDRRTEDNPYKLRPYIIRMIECKDISIRDITLLNSPMWVQHYLACDDLVIDGITVKSRVAANNDGIDIDSCHGVRVANCNISSGDDAIVIKATSARACQNVVVTNCVISSHCNAFKLGTESNGGFNNIVFSNSTIYDTDLAAIALEIVDGGVLERVDINNIVINNAGTALFLRLGNRARPFLSTGPGGSAGDFKELAGATKPGMSTFRNVSISHILADGIGRVGCSITGIVGRPAQDIRLQDIRINFAGGGTQEPANAVVPEKEKSYPEYEMFGRLPAYGFFIRHIDGIKIKGMNLGFDKPDARPALVFDDVKNVQLVDFDAKLGNGAEALIRMKNVRGGFIHGCRIDENISVFLDATNTQNIKLLNNDFHVKQVVRQDENSSIDYSLK